MGIERRDEAWRGHGLDDGGEPGSRLGLIDGTLLARGAGDAA
jgi:hypothetical protein